MFKTPPLGSTSLPALYDWHYLNSPDHPLFVFEEGPGIRTICWKEGVQGIHRASQSIAGTVGSNDSDRRPVIAVLASSDTITYFCFIVGVMRLGWSVFPISPRNSPPTIASLLKQVGATHVFKTSDQPIQSVVDASLSILSQDDDYTIKVQVMPFFHDLFPQRGADPLFEFNPILSHEMTLPALILHSSGTTSTPKAITWTQSALARGATVPTFGDLVLTGMVMACYTIPMFHAMGAINLMAAPSRGVIMAMLPPQCPAQILDPVNVLNAALATKCDFILCVPTFLEIWSRDASIVEKLTKLKGLVCGGAVLTKAVGDLLTSKGVRLQPVYGSTEAGLLSRYLSELPGKDWEYFCFTPNREVKFFPDSSGICEAIAVASLDYEPCVINTTFEGRKAYLLSDLFVQHETKPHLWKIVGRLDDQVMLSAGEKVNPIPLEGILTSDPHVQAAIIVGQSRFQLAVIVEPNPEFQFDTSDTEKVIAFRNLIWPTVQRANESAPAYARIFKEMILIASPIKPFSYTLKGVARRKEATSLYKEEIDLIYRAAEESSQTDIGEPADWTASSLLAFTRKVVNTILGRTVPDEDDIFNHGCDSLNATWMRNSLLRVLRKQHPQVARDLPTNFVYNHPSIVSLSRFISTSVSPNSSDSFTENATIKSEKDSMDRLGELVTEFTENIAITDDLVSDGRDVSGDTILITGGTGSLGCVILAQLLESKEIAHVYSLGRKSTTKFGAESLSLSARHKKAFDNAGLNSGLLDSEKLTIVESDLVAADIGITQQLLHKIRSSVTHIIYCAWKVDFNHSVESFGEELRGLRNIVEVALSCSRSSTGLPPKFIFVSSAASVHSAPSPVQEVSFASPFFALGTGYAESKWVAERALELISQRTPLEVIVARPGQISGGPSGAWKESEWFPSLVKTSIALSCLPDIKGSISWLPAEVASQALVQFRKAEGTRFFHLVNPSSTAWTDVVGHFSSFLGLPIVPYSEWLEKLEASHKNLTSGSLTKEEQRGQLRTAPALNLIDAFRDYASQAEASEREPLGLPQLSCKLAMSASSALQDASHCPIGRTEVKRWLDYWYSSGFLPKDLK